MVKTLVLVVEEFMAYQVCFASVTVSDAREPFIVLSQFLKVALSKLVMRNVDRFRI
jgi:hypothetical protein